MKRLGYISLGPVLVSALALSMLAGLPSGCASESRQPASTSAPASASARIGTYDSRAVAIAYGRSATHARYVEGLIAKRKQALADGNSKVAAEMEAAGEAQQIRLHLQAFSNAPVDDALDSVRDRLAGVAERAGVCAIVSVADYRGSGVQVVDVTDELVALFNPDEATLRIIRDSRNHKPLAIETVAKMPAKG